MTAFQITLLVQFAAVVTLCWFRGGHPERYGAGWVLIVLIAEHILPDVTLAGFRPLAASSDLILAGVFIHQAMTGDRWWPFFAAGASLLVLMLHLSILAGSDIGWRAYVSAQVGLGALLFLTLLAGIAERRLSGERPAFETSRGWRG